MGVAQGTDAANTRRRILCTLVASSETGATGATRAKASRAITITQCACLAVDNTAARVAAVSLLPRSYRRWLDCVRSRLQKDVEGCCWSVWTMERLGQLLMCTPDAVNNMDVKQCTAANVVFPEVRPCAGAAHTGLGKPNSTPFVCENGGAVAACVALTLCWRLVLTVWLSPGSEWS